MTLRTTALAALMFGAVALGQASAQEAPALKGASPEEKARVGALIEGAVKEGSLSYWDTVIQPGTNDKLVRAFKERYGLPAAFKVNYTLSQTGDLVTRIEQELGASRVTIDVAAISAPIWVFERMNKGELLEYRSPEYAHYKRIFEAGLGVDGYFAFNGGYVFVPMWNSENLDFKGKSYTDMIAAVPEGKLSMGDAANSTTFLATYMGQRTVLPADFFTKLAAKKPILLRRSEQLAAGLVTGEQTMTLSGMPTRAYQMNQKGAKLKFVFPKEGVMLLAPSTFILAKAPHPNAAKLWIDFILSETGQKILTESEALISGRAGFKSPIPEYSPPIESLNLIKFDWSKLNVQDMAKAKADWLNTFNP
ncbi:ABC transporter substrate-binding protein [Aquabacter spiritensis]|uniref:ABC-type Fe3+ transport system substrate-binding protein n=1 Tax=Aquabacter spiritensis TaxID=933073 RepID=A0A4R3M6V0_9HYPH|nr:extracellular solute-binding protein [Aquabacter spiritensis]TCT08323.1 ABC-type Fe3+ transport system substrate-binding protein [Aquabacter spiritensis]